MKKFIQVLFTAFIGYLIYFFIFTIPPQAIETKPLVIEKGQGVGEIASLLKSAGYIKSKFGFETLVWLKGASSGLQAGEYKLPTTLSLNQLVDYLAKGIGAMASRELKIIEGWTIDDIGAYLEEQGITTKQEFKIFVGVSNSQFPISNFQFLLDKPKKVGLEGYLFPDTYQVYKNATAEDIARKMLENFDKKLTVEMRADIEKRGRTIFDIVRMASIIEAEVPHVEDRPIISGLLWKRLEVGMLLQVDSTLNYSTGNKSRALSLEELKIDSMYNSYKYPGLPPTPIGNPGLDAIRAAIYPKESPYWFFLSSKDGKTIFSKTLEEHNAAKAKYL